MTNNFKISWPTKVLILVGMMLVALFVVALSAALVFGINNTGKVAQVITMVLQNIIVFIVPVVVLASL